MPQIRRKKRRIGSAESGILRKQSTRKNEVWGLDFIFDRTADGRPIKMLVVLDEYTRENIALEVSRKLKSHDVIMVLDELTAIRGAPENIRSDNGSEFIADVMKEWCKESGTNTLYIEPGAPWQNGIVESFNSRLRDELLSSEIFTTLAEAQLLCARWRADYNHRRPQRAGQANTGGTRGKVRSICGAKVGATDANGGKHTKGSIDYDRPNLIRGGSAVGYRSHAWLKI